MASGKERTIYFFEPVVLDKSDTAQEIADGLWADLLKNVSALPEDDRRTIYRARRYEGETSSTKSPMAEYLYIAKLRPGADWPDIRDINGAHGTLASTGAVGALLEPAYLVAVSGTNYCAILRSSAGPTFSAIESWINQTCGFVKMKERFELRPFVRKDQLERLAASQGASKVRLRVEPDALEGAEMDSELGKALKAAQQAAGGGVTVDMTISFGHVAPDGAGAQSLTRGVADILKHSGVKHASATLLREDEDGDLIRDRTDFVRDRVTFTEEVGDSQDEQPTPEVVMAAMAEAIAEFKKQL